MYLQMSVFVKICMRVGINLGYRVWFPVFISNFKTKVDNLCKEIWFIEHYAEKMQQHQIIIMKIVKKLIYFMYDKET